MPDLRPILERLRARLKSRDAEGHEHKPSGPGGGQFTGQGSGGGGESAPAPKGRRAPREGDPVHSYLPAFQEPDGEKPTAADAKAANQDLKGEGSKYRVIPDGKGGWQAAHVADLVDEYGSRWAVVTNPLTGEPDVGDLDYFRELKPLAGDRSSQSYLHAFNDPRGGDVTAEDVATANRELESDGSPYRIAHSPEYGMWVARRAGKGGDGGPV